MTSFVCKFENCSRSFKHACNRSDHHNWHKFVKKEFLHKCCYCDFKYNLLTEFSKHLDDIHPDLRKTLHKCLFNGCHEHFSYKLLRTKHHQAVHMKEPLTDKTVELRQKYPKKNFQTDCKLCPKKFSTHQELKKHWRNHKLRCGFCQSTFFTLSERERHYKAHRNLFRVKHSDKNPDKFKIQMDTLETFENSSTFLWNWLNKEMVYLLYSI